MWNLIFSYSVSQVTQGDTLYRPLLVLQLNQLPSDQRKDHKNQQQQHQQSAGCKRFRLFVCFKLFVNHSSEGAVTFSNRANAKTSERRARPEDAGRAVRASAALKPALPYRWVSCSGSTGSCVRENSILHRQNLTADLPPTASTCFAFIFVCFSFQPCVVFTPHIHKVVNLASASEPRMPKQFPHSADTLASN